MWEWISPVWVDHQSECSHGPRTPVCTGAPLSLQELLKTEHTNSQRFDIIWMSYSFFTTINHWCVLPWGRKSSGNVTADTELHKSNKRHKGWLQQLSLTFACPGCQARRHRDFALLTSFVFCSRGQLITWVWMDTSRSASHRLAGWRAREMNK